MRLFFQAAILFVFVLSNIGIVFAEDAVVLTPEAMQKIKFMGWKDSYKLQTDSLEAVVVPAIGRVMSFRFKGEQNVFLVKEKRAGLLPSKQIPVYQVLGGLYTWIAPETQWIKPGDQRYNGMDATLDFGPYTVKRITDNELTMESPVSETYGLLLTKIIRLEDQTPRMEYTVTLKNAGKQPIRWSLWNLNSVQPTGIVFFETPHKDADLNFFADRDPEKNQRRFGLTLQTTEDKLGIADFRKFNTKAAKVSVRVGSPWLAYRQPGSWLIRTFEADTLAMFTDQQSQIELRADAVDEKYFELEVLSPEYLIKPGESVSWRETMYLVADTKPLSKDPTWEAEKIPKILKRLDISNTLK